VSVTFLKGALLKDPKGPFNGDMKGNAMRAIVIHEQDVTDENAFKGLIRAAVALNTSKNKKTPRLASQKIDPGGSKRFR
jgi:hypothetical protein